MRVLRAQRAGFTLVELLIVIAIIVVLMAIAFPVFSRARQRAKEAQCMSNLHQLAQAVRMYRMDEGGYPGPPDLITGQGGVNALYPTYVTNRKVLVCPDDPITDAKTYMEKTREFVTPTSPGIPYSQLVGNSNLYFWQESVGTTKTWKDSVFDGVYSSYNRYYNYYGYTPTAGDFVLPNFTGPNVVQHVDLGESVSFVYEWLRWDPEHKLDLDKQITMPDMTQCYSNFVWVDCRLGLDLAQQVYWYEYVTNPDPEGPTRLKDDLDRYLWDPDPTRDPNVPTSTGWYLNGIPSAVFPGLINRNAPDNTIITRCPNHRSYTLRRGVKEDVGKDIVLRLDGSAALLSVKGANYNWARQSEQTH